MRWLAALAMLWSAGCAARQEVPPAWPDWQAFATAFIDDQGRVIDWTAGGRTVSEGQAYGLFFALVANDRPRFERILSWTQRNLAAGDIATNNLSWIWGRRPDDSWGVIDANAASDADLWLAYTLIEAGRLWRQPQYRELGRNVLQRVKAQMVHAVPRGPQLLLPGPQGFVDGDKVRINPSYYVPVQLLRFQAEDPQGPWRRMLTDFVAAVPAIAPLGRMPDWVQWNGERFVEDPVTRGVGGYDAIRVYLWAAFGPEARADVRELRTALKPFSAMIQELGYAPEHWSIGNSGIDGRAPPGFQAALIPFFRMLGMPAEVERANAALTAVKVDGLYGRPAHYYDHALIVFGKGFAEGRFRFNADGSLIPTWKH